MEFSQRRSRRGKERGHFTAKIARIAKRDGAEAIDFTDLTESELAGECRKEGCNASLRLRNNNHRNGEGKRQPEREGEDGIMEWKLEISNLKFENWRAGGG
jgi:hypothetical protein